MALLLVPNLAGGGSGITQLTGDVTAGPGSGSQVATLVNIPNDVTQAGDLLATGIAAPAAPAAGKGRAWYDSTTKTWRAISTSGTLSSTVQDRSAFASNFVTSIVSGVASISQPAFTDISGTATVAQLPDVVIGVQTFTAGGTYTATAGTRSQMVEIWGGGGGGGGSAIGTAANAGMGGGGGAGSYARRRYAIVGAGTGTVVIGAAGAAGAVTGAVAGAGGNSTFTDGTTLMTAPGGSGAPAQLAVAATLLWGLGGAGGAVSTNGNVNGRGAHGGACGRTAPAAANGAIGGRGGATLLGGEGQERVTQGAGNAAAANTGSGGGGAVAIGAVAAVLGGAGAAGFCVITEYA